MTKEDNIILYHYTTMNTFYNMIEHSLCYDEGDIHPKYITMWATHYAFQNDPTECQLFFEGLKAGVLDYTKKNNIALNDKEKELTQHPQYNLNIFTISFSKQEDDLTMWRGYGQNGDGISLGFDFSKLPSTLPMYGADCKERKYWSESEPTYLLYDEIKKCEYVDTNNIKIAEEACNKALPEWHRPWRCSQGRCSHRSCYRRCADPCPAHGSQRSQWHRLPLPCQRSTAASWRRTGCRQWGLRCPCLQCPGQSRGWARTDPGCRRQGWRTGSYRWNR